MATPPPDLCGTWKVPAWSPDSVSDGRETNMVSGFHDTREDAGGQAIGEAIFQGAGEVVEEDKTSVIVISRSESISSMIY